MGTELYIASVLSFGLLFLFMASGMWVFAALGLAGVVTSSLLLHSLAMIPFIPFSSTNSWTLTAIPFFVFTGEIFLHSGIMEGVYATTETLSKRIPGRLLHTNIVACSMFGTLTGSAAATAATIGTVSLPQLEKRGYDMRVATASVAAGGILGGLIPPSTVFIIYGSMTGVSVGQLFFAGIIPGIILTLIFMGIIVVWTLKNPAIAPRDKGVKGFSVTSLKTYVPLAIISFFILGGIYLGVYTVSEAGAIACTIAVIVVALYRKLSWAVLNRAVRATLEITCMFMIIIMGSAIFSNSLAGLLIPHKIAKWMAEISVHPLVVLLIITVLYVFLGCFIEALAIMIMTLPVVFPVITLLGFDPLWFGVVMYVYMGTGCITPPLGTNLYVVMGIRGERGSLSEVVAGIYPFIFGLFVLLVILVAFPSVATWLPGKMFVR